MKGSVLYLCALVSGATAFRSGVMRPSVMRGVRPLAASPEDMVPARITEGPAAFEPFDGLLCTETANEGDHEEMKAMALLGALATVFLPVEGAFANEYGIFAGRTASMLHPVTMFALFATSVYSGYLGLQWRRLRGLSDEIKALSSQLPLLSSGPAKYPVSDMIAAINVEIATLQSATELPTANGAQRLAALQKDVTLLKGASEVDAKIKALTDTRKSLQTANLRDKHWATGSWLLGAGVTVSLLGAFNTYMRAGKLFPGPHLYAGMGVTILWATAAALVPAMQKGNEAARIGHIALNTVNVGLFAWQVVTGFDIAVKVWEKTSFP